MVASERSITIRTLEEELGTPLFVCTTCRVEPTQAGQLFAEFAQSTRKGYEAFQAVLAAGQRQREKLVLQVPATMAARDPLYHNLLLALSRELPDCDLEVITDSACHPPGRHPARDPDTKDPCSRRARPCRGGRQIVNGKYKKAPLRSTILPPSWNERSPQQDLQSGRPCGQLPFQRQVGVNF